MRKITSRINQVVLQNNNTKMHTYLAWLIVRITVIEHSIKIFDTLLSTGIHIFLQFFLYFTHVHRMFDNIIIILIKILTFRKYDEFYGKFQELNINLPASST